jgi:hypothetical protein
VGRIGAAGMNRNDIIRMAREAGFQDHGVAEMWGHLTASKGHIERFFRAAYEAGAAAEREACAQVCETEGSVDDLPEHYAAAIRARGEKT